MSIRTNGVSKNKYAMIMVVDPAYLRGANAIINAMDYYGNTMDLIIIYDLLPDEYIDNVLSMSFNFRIEFIPYDDLKDEFYADCPGLLKNRFNYSCYVRHWYITKIKEQYAVTGIIESDAMLLDNITPWFEFAEGTDRLLTAYHVYQSFELENLLEEHLAFIQPLYIHPLICDPKKWSGMFENMIQIASEQPETIDMMAMNQAVFNSGNRSNVVVLADPEWLGGWIYTQPVRKLTLNNGRVHLVTFPSMTRIKILHGKYYSEGFRNNIIQSVLPEHRSIVSDNMAVITEFFKFFNDTLKVKLPDEFRFDMDRSA